MHLHGEGCNRDSVKSSKSIPSYGDEAVVTGKAIAYELHYFHMHSPAMEASFVMFSVQFITYILPIPVQHFNN